MPDILPDESFDETRKCRLAPPSPVGWGQVVHLSTLFITFHARRGGNTACCNRSGGCRLHGNLNQRIDAYP